MNKRQRLKHKNHRIALWHAVTHGDMRRTRKLLRLVKADREILHGAIFSGQSRGLVELVQQSVGLSAEDVKISMFFYAVQDDDVPAVEAFIRLGMSPDTILNEYGSRPLHCAYSGKMAQALIAAGADVNALNRFGEPPVSLCAQGSAEGSAGGGCKCAHHRKVWSNSSTASSFCGGYPPLAGGGRRPPSFGPRGGYAAAYSRRC